MSTNYETMSFDTLSNIGCASTKKTKIFRFLFCFVFGFHYICTFDILNLIKTQTL